jgi:hypothetical protein
VLVPINQTARELLARRHELPVTLTVTLTNGAGGIVGTRGILIRGLNARGVAGAIEKAILSQAPHSFQGALSCGGDPEEGQQLHVRCHAPLGKGKHKIRVEVIFAATQQNDQSYVTFVGD